MPVKKGDGGFEQPLSSFQDRHEDAGLLRHPVKNLLDAFPGQIEGNAFLVAIVIFPDIVELRARSHEHFQPELKHAN
ncbi:MAG: hypothetical protein JW950_07465 [Deltaproteobacteria bacterium]|nr:hypothetical protein [Deltaproteobacteria bacterium]